MLVRSLASMYHASSFNSIQSPWIDLQPIRLGAVPPGNGTPEKYVAVERDGQPFLRIDVYPEWEGPFWEVVVWEAFVIVAWGDAVCLVELLSKGVRTIACDEYFSRLYPLDALLLIASASEVICIDQGGNEVWRRGGLAIDGIVIDRVANGLIIGQGEWDPPGGWQSFRLELHSGRAVEG